MNETPIVTIALASSQDAPGITALIGKLLNEIMTSTGAQSFNFDAEDTGTRCSAFIEEKHYTVLTAVAVNQLIGVLTLTASGSLYAGGKFGVIQELYVDEGYRSQGIGGMLVDAARQHGKEQGWVRLEVATPPLPAFERSLAFYKQQNFEITGGRKMKISL